ncbi:MAG: hypothetical protein OXI87_00240 [Albidovulum sp.]|nr:hypothetical protein [Albidovulum sp.]MDE0303303.1 hypothetical protein [Albidovulum sp.]
MKISRFVPADRMWDGVKNMLPGRQGSPGRTAVDNRLFLEPAHRRNSATGTAFSYAFGTGPGRGFSKAFSRSCPVRSTLSGRRWTAV